MCFNFLTGRTGPSMGPQSSADKAAGGYVPPGDKSNLSSSNSNIKKITPAPINVPGAEKIKQTFQQQKNNAKNANQIADRMVLKAKKKLPVPSGSIDSYWQPFKNWQGTTSRSGKTILGA